jgi:signal transduction histidine kinase/CheY-like chemotaxis protein
VKRWFDRLPIHRKLVAMALLVTTAALTLSTALLLAVDVGRYRTTAADDTSGLARVLAENIAAAVLFNDPDDARRSLSTVRVRPTVAKACLYLPDGMLFAAFERSPQSACPASLPQRLGWTTVAGTASVSRNDRTLGSVYVERELIEIWGRVAVAIVGGGVVLILAATFALALANRLHRTVSAPIAHLASVVRTMDSQHPTAPVLLHGGVDEVGDLVRSFGEMLGRARDASARLRESNDALIRKEAEREQLLTREREASRLKDEFLAAVSHELRTPLNAILGWAHILSTTVVDAPTSAKAIASIARNAKAQSRVIDDLVDVSRIVTGKLSLRVDVVDIRETVEAAVDVIRPAAQVKSIRVDLHAPAHICLVSGDAERLQQVVWNLLSNAVKFTPRNGAVRLSLTEVDGVYQLDVTDTGEGIAPHFLPYVFDRFRQADGSTTREHGGLGLGLAIVKELTELHGGSVTVASDGAGRGARFSIRLPQLAGLKRAVEPAGAPQRLPRLDTLTVLAVDDNADALDVLVASLAAAGAHVRVVSSGDEAVREWSRDPADVLVCDLAMPQMDGFEVLTAIQRLDALRNRATHAVALTAHASADYQERARAAGFLFHLAKPYDAGELLRAVSAAART